MRESHFSDGVAEKVMDGFFSILLGGEADERFDVGRFELGHEVEDFDLGHSRSGMLGTAFVIVMPPARIRARIGTGSDFRSDERGNALSL